MPRGKADRNAVHLDRLDLIGHRIQHGTVDLGHQQRLDGGFQEIEGNSRWLAPKTDKLCDRTHLNQLQTAEVYTKIRERGIGWGFKLVEVIEGYDFSDKPLIAA